MLTIKYRKVKEGRKVIDALLTHNSTRIELSTGIRIPDGMNFDQRVFSGGSSSAKAEKELELHEWESMIRNRYTAMVATHGYTFPADVFRAGIKAVSSRAREEEFVDQRATLSAFSDQIMVRASSGIMSKKSSGRAYSDNSIRSFLQLSSLINEFVMKYGDFDFAKYNQNTEAALGRAAVIRAYDTLCERIKVFFLKDKGYGITNVSNLVTQIKSAIMERCESHGISLAPRYLAILKYKNTAERIVVALSAEQFEWIINNEELIRKDAGRSGFIVDYMMAGLMTSARIGDLNRLTTDNLIMTEEGYVLSYIPQKTNQSSGVRVDVPVSDRLAAMFMRNASRYNGRLLRPVEFLGRMAGGIRKILSRYDEFRAPAQYQDKHGKIHTVPFWKAFKFHSTRASLITYLLSKGEQETVIKSISGHTIDSKSFKHYTNITNQTKVRMMQRVALIGTT